MIKNRKVKNIEDGTKKVNKLYLQFGFNINRIHSDSEFEPLSPEMAGLVIFLNCVSKKEHVPNIELPNWTAKERVQYTQAEVPFRQISKSMIIHLVSNVIFWMNAFIPFKPGAGLSNTKPPRQLLLGTTVDYKKVFHIYPGEYFQVHQED